MGAWSVRTLLECGRHEELKNRASQLEHGFGYHRTPRTELPYKIYIIGEMNATNLRNKMGKGIPQG